MSTLEDIVRRLNSEGILKEYTSEVYNKALEDLREKLLDTISHEYDYPYFDNAIYGLVNDALVDSIKKLKQ